MLHCLSNRNVVCLFFKIEARSLSPFLRSQPLGNILCPLHTGSPGISPWVENDLLASLQSHLPFLFPLSWSVSPPAQDKGGSQTCFWLWEAHALKPAGLCSWPSQAMRNLCLLGIRWEQWFPKTFNLPPGGLGTPLIKKSWIRWLF